MLLSSAQDGTLLQKSRDDTDKNVTLPQLEGRSTWQSIQKYQSEKRVGKRKSINEITQRDQTMARKQRRHPHLNRRRKIKEGNHILTPPSSPIEQEGNLNAEIPIPGPSRQMQSARKKHKQKTNKCDREQE